MNNIFKLILEFLSSNNFLKSSSVDVGLNIIVPNSNMISSKTPLIYKFKNYIFICINSKNLKKKIIKYQI